MIRARQAVGAGAGCTRPLEPLDRRRSTLDGTSSPRRLIALEARRLAQDAPGTGMFRVIEETLPMSS